MAPKCLVLGGREEIRRERGGEGRDNERGGER